MRVRGGCGPTQASSSSVGGSKLPGPQFCPQDRETMGCSRVGGPGFVSQRWWSQPFIPIFQLL